jgi:hypothetical protein
MAASNASALTGWTVSARALDLAADAAQARRLSLQRIGVGIDRRQRLTDQLENHNALEPDGRGSLSAFFLQPLS